MIEPLDLTTTVELKDNFSEQFKELQNAFTGTESIIKKTLDSVLSLANGFKSASLWGRRFRMEIFSINRNIENSVLKFNSLNYSARALSSSCKNFTPFTGTSSSALLSSASANKKNSQVLTNAMIERVENRSRKPFTPSIIASPVKNAVNTSNFIGNGLLMPAAMAGIFSVGAFTSFYKNLFQQSGTFANTRTRLSMINDSRQSDTNLLTKVFRAAENTRVDFSAFGDFITSVGMNAPTAFKSNDELINFGEQLQKMFVISGTSGEARSSAMLQLSQALASGRLQGDEFRSISESAPMLLNIIAKYLGKTRGEVREMSTAGTLTPEIIKNAVLSSQKATDEQFKKMPVTFDQVMAKIKNTSTIAFSEVYNKLGKIFTGEKMEKTLENLKKLIVSFAMGVSWSIDLMTRGLSWSIENWDLLTGAIESVILSLGTLAAAYVSFQTASMLITVANPWGAVALSIGAAVFALNEFTKESNAAFNEHKTTLGTVIGIWKGFATLIEDAFRYAVNVVKMTSFLIPPVYHAAKLTEMPQDIAEKPYTDKIKKLESERQFYYNKLHLRNEFSTPEHSEEYKAKILFLDEELKKTKKDYADVKGSRATDDFFKFWKYDWSFKNPLEEGIKTREKVDNENYNAQQKIKKMLSQIKTSDKTKMPSVLPINTNLNDIKHQTKKIAKNTESNANLIKWLRAAVEQKVLIKYTSSPIKINLTANNSITERNFDGAIASISEKLRNALINSTKGVADY